MKQKSIVNPHDKFFKYFFQEEITAKNFLMEFLPANVREIVDVDSIKIQKESFLNENLNECFSDILYKLKICGRDSFVYVLFEHKSYIDNYVSLQLLRYMTEIWQYLRKEKNLEFLPRIIPLVFYHAEEHWKVKELKSLFMDNSNTLDKYLPNFRYELFDIKRLDIPKIGNEVIIVVLSIFKYGAKIVQHEEIFLRLNYLSKERQKAVIVYIQAIVEKEEREELKKIILKNMEEGNEIMVSIADSYREEENNKVKEVIKRVKKGDSNEIIHETTGMDLEKIKEFRELVS